MALETITNINVDFYDKKYILINAKQLDKNSRFLLVTCYNHGEPFTLSAVNHSAYIRYKKADEYSVFNACDINNGKIIVELTEQMLAASGICDADLIVVEGGSAKFDPISGEMIGIDGSSILSTMTFHIDVSETAVENTEIESNYDLSALDESLIKLNANYQDVIKKAQLWAVGNNPLDVGNPSDTNNAKYWAEVAAQNAVGVPAVVTGIKGDSETSYRHGQVIITASNVGAIPTTDIATVSEMKNYLGI